MKRNFILLFIATSLIGYGQTEKGRATFGLSQANFSVTKAKNDELNYSSKQTYFGLTPSGGYFILNNLLVGGNLSYTYSNVKNEGSYRSNLNNFNIGPMVEYYIGAGLKGKPFINFSAGYGWGRTKSSYDNVTSSTSNLKIWNVNPSIGYALFINDSFMVRFSGGYDFQKYEVPSDLNQSRGRFYLGVGVLATFKR